VAVVGATGGAADAQQWGLFDEDGNPLVEADTVLGVDVQADAGIANYPQQDGAFASYNKVQQPTNVKVTYGVSGSDEARFDLIDRLDVAKRSLKTYVLGMPEYSYPSVNVIHYAMRREVRRGLKLLQVEVLCEEVRILGRTYVRFGKSVNGSGTKAQGNLQATPLSDQPALAAKQADLSMPPATFLE
jgi:hypothetical protein